tara:strand:- start:2394 stop:3779 length:1386 start_codon:yes stop_codon:yes gene_type:complete
MINGLFIFHRDFRIIDNKSLIELSKQVDNLFCCFIFTPEQVSNSNSYKSSNSIQFMIECLNDLSNYLKDNNGKLMLFYGKTEEITNKLIIDLNIDILGFNLDITPYAKERTNKIKKICENNNVNMITLNDYYLFEPGSIKVSTTNKAYTKYSPFLNYTKNIIHDKIDKFKIKNFKKNSYKNNITLSEAEERFVKFNENKLVFGSRNNALDILKKIKHNNFNNYEKERNSLEKNGTTLLSAYIKFGCISVRETADVFKKVEALYKQLLWREFYAHILNDFPYVLGKPLKEKYNQIIWSKSKTNFEAWCKGVTGFPIVDAGIRELLSTGYMHNRSRLITASFLIKTLLIDWKKGEKFFAQNLTDYDVASNNGNWQWVASTGADSQPYFRIFNPWRQSKTYDPNCIYIKKWIPELNHLPNNEIHEYFKYYENYIKDKDFKYVSPIVEYSIQREKALDMYKIVNE